MFNKVKIGNQNCVHGDVAAFAVNGVTNGRYSCRLELGLHDWINCRIILYYPDNLARQSAVRTHALKELLSH